ncbi:hypothetical protein EDB29_1011105 [Vibrio crassostreae]|uniref:phage tail fiber protein n=1 Tax=Vibrio crassostreae TaxID=246167 RepID=UPI00104ADB93|nr:hypothetical protein [Vibrio crassostreae]CAH6851256.1 conserved hypothetical protein [Vibrio chagasii]TCT44293.1 hypothetical protein EDB29_1011105 [Vibrio crassostreae]CAH6862956.1 conserved hypothetical protein [Vibrio chagasii]CAH6928242.1 conserved hypothetical protein [Vibrio chagasii]CAH6947483.1 conserved hypothetical protein [Vibrio chagasii]
MADVGHLGAVITLSASVTTSGVPVPLTDFPKDTDPFDIPDIEIAETEMGTNGDLISWSVANPLPLTIGAIPNTEMHVFLQTLLSRNRPEKGKRPVGDTFVLVRVLPNGEVATFTGGKMTGGSPIPSMGSSGKLSTPTFSFSFAKLVVVPANLLLS